MDEACRRLGKLLHLDAFRRTFEAGARIAQGSVETEWVIVYRTAKGVCCMSRGVALEFEAMPGIQLWSEEMEVQTYFIGQ